MSKEIKKGRGIQTTIPSPCCQELPFPQHVLRVARPVGDLLFRLFRFRIKPGHPFVIALRRHRFVRKFKHLTALPAPQNSGVFHDILFYERKLSAADAFIPIPVSDRAFRHQYHLLAKIWIKQKFGKELSPLILKSILKITLT